MAKKTQAKRGLGALEKEMLAAKDTDNVDTSIRGQDGSEVPAGLTEGEIVFSIPAIIAAGEGDYEAGTELLLSIHEMLREKAKSEFGYEEEQGEQQVGGLGALLSQP